MFLSLHKTSISDYGYVNCINVPYPPVKILTISKMKEFRVSLSGTPQEKPKGKKNVGHKWLEMITGESE